MKDSPKVSTVNNQVLLSYDQAKNTGSLSLSESNAKGMLFSGKSKLIFQAAPKVGPVNEQVRLKYDDAKNSGSLSFSEQNAMSSLLCLLSNVKTLPRKQLLMNK